MQFISCHSGKIHRLGEKQWEEGARNFSLGLEAIDELLPRGFERGAIHELLMAPESGLPRFMGLLLAKAAMGDRAVVWCDPEHEVYPPAIAAAGLPLDKLYLLYPQNVIDEHWAVAECLRCKGVGATIATPQRLSHVQARRLQLAAEAGGGVGILLRAYDKNASIYAAATRWLIEPSPGERTIQRWKIQLIHGHGGRTHRPVYLECHREEHRVSATAQLADRSLAPPAHVATG